MIKLWTYINILLTVSSIAVHWLLGLQGNVCQIKTESLLASLNNSNSIIMSHLKIFIRNFLFDHKTRGESEL